MLSSHFHSGYVVSNVERSIAFYGSTVGIDHTTTQVSNQPYLAQVTGHPGCSLLIGFARVEGDPHGLELIQYVYPKGGSAGVGFGRVGTPHLCWVVDNLPLLYDRLGAQGVTFLMEPRLVGSAPWGDWLGTFLLDPDGLLVELISSADAPSGEGRLAHMHHTGVTVSNLEAALDFLCGQLGLRVAEQFEGDTRFSDGSGQVERTRIRSAYLPIGSANYFLEVCEFRNPLGPAADVANNKVGTGHFCFLVDDISAEYEALCARGVEFVGPPALVTAGVNKGARAIYFKGPDNIRFELFQKPETQQV